MQLHILTDEHIRLDTAGGGDGLTVEGENFGPLQMLAASLALCTVSVIHSYAETANLDLEGLAVELRWEYAEEPYRVGRYDMTLHLPESLPTARHRPILRAAETCTVHHTLQHPPTIATAIETFIAVDDGHAAHHHHHVEHLHDEA